MMKKKIMVTGIILSFFGMAFIPTANGDNGNIDDINSNLTDHTNNLVDNTDYLDSQFIYNITENLSYIILREYNESAGKIPKGRYFGTKGEHKAAKILEENMSKLGLWTTVEQIQNIPNMLLGKEIYETLTHDVEVLDYGLKIDGKPVDCYIAPPCK